MGPFVLICFWNVIKAIVNNTVEWIETENDKMVIVEIIQLVAVLVTATTSMIRLLIVNFLVWNEVDR